MAPVVLTNWHSVGPTPVTQVGGGGGANQTLGFHVTSDELAIWRTRKTDNVNAIGGVTYQTMFNAINSSAGNFTSSSVGNWDPGPGTGGTWTATTNFPDNTGGSDNTHSPSFDQGREMLCAAFVAMVNNDSTLGNRVVTFLLNHANRSTLDFSNSTAWQLTNYDGVMIRVAPFLAKCLFAYDYVRIGGFPSSSDKTTIETWLNKAGTWLMNKTDTQVATNAFPNRLTDDYSACTGGQCGASLSGRLYYLAGGVAGPQVNSVTETWSNRIGAAVTFFGAAANPVNPAITWNANFGPRAKRYVTEFLQYSVWNTSTPHETYRWNDGGTADQAIASSCTHAWYQVGPNIS